MYSVWQCLSSLSIKCVCVYSVCNAQESRGECCLPTLCANNVLTGRQWKLLFSASESDQLLEMRTYGVELLIKNTVVCRRA